MDFYQNKKVRDLAWALKSAPLLDFKTDEIITPDQTFYDKIYENFKSHLKNIDQNPTPLEDFLNTRSNNQRLGFYFENLIHYWLIHNQRYQVIKDHLAIHDQGKTIGEFDFIIKDHLTSKIYHWELTIKYYLKLKNLWFGPNQKDRLDLKIDKLISHQTQLSKNPVVAKKLKNLKIRIDETWVFSKGYLFYPFDDHKTNSNHIHPNHLKGFWSTLSDFIKKFSHQNCHWKIVDKKNWLSKNRISDENILKIKDIQKLKVLKPIQLEGHKNQDCIRVFLVPDKWESI